MSVGDPHLYPLSLLYIVGLPVWWCAYYCFILEPPLCYMLMARLILRPNGWSFIGPTIYCLFADCCILASYALACCLISALEPSMADLKERLLPPKPASAINLREASYRLSTSGHQPFHGVDVLGLKKRGQGLRSWIRVDTSGNSEVIEVDKFTMMRRCDLPARDLRLLDPLFVYPSTILGREKAIVVNLEQIRCIITADEVLLLNSLDSYVLQYVVELQRRLTTAGVGRVWKAECADLSGRRGSRNFDNIFGDTSPDNLPFEFRALEVALETACTFLDSQVCEIC